MFGCLSLITLLLIIVCYIVFIAINYKVCPPDKIIVIYGKTGHRCDEPRFVVGGGAFIFPLIQKYEMLSLSPMMFDVIEKEFISKDKAKVLLSTSTVYAVSTSPKILKYAALRLLGLSQENIQTMAEKIINNTLELSVSCFEFEKMLIGNNWEFTEETIKTLDLELNKIGLQIINFNIKAVSDKNSNDIS